MYLLYCIKRIVFVIFVFSICCGCSISRRNIDKQISQNFGDLQSVDLKDPAVAHSYVGTDAGADVGADVGVSSIVGGVKTPKPKVKDLSVIINPGMLLNISVEVYGKDEIYKEGCNVSREGDIYLPFLKSVPVSGLTIIEAEKKLTELFSEYFVNPLVDVLFSQTGDDNFVSPWGYVTVMGNVVNPRRIALPQGIKLKLSEAVALAGGLAPSAKDRAVVLIRRADDGKIVKKKVNLRSIVASGKIDRDLDLLPNDYIFVPETIF